MATPDPCRSKCYDLVGAPSRDAVFQNTKTGTATTNCLTACDADIPIVVDEPTLARVLVAGNTTSDIDNLGGNPIIGNEYTVDLDAAPSGFTSSLAVTALAGVDFSVEAQSSTTGGGAGLLLSAGSATVTGNGGELDLSSGGAVTGTSGVVSIVSGSTTTGAAGAVTLAVGDAATAPGLSGQMTIHAGNVTAVGDGGWLIMAGGNSITGAGGLFQVTGGQSSSGLGGSCSILGGPSNANAGGPVFINGGSSNASGAGGNVFISGGIATDGPGGDVQIQGGNTPDGTGGDVSVTGGSGDNFFNGGNITILSGDSPTQQSGTVTIGSNSSASGQPTGFVEVNTSAVIAGTAASGYIRLITGPGRQTVADNGTGQLLLSTGANAISAGTSGSVKVYTGDSTANDSGITGRIEIVTGDAAGLGGGNRSGHIFLQPGSTPLGTGATGEVVIGSEGLTNQGYHLVVSQVTAPDVTTGTLAGTTLAAAASDTAGQITINTAGAGTVILVFTKPFNSVPTVIITEQDTLAGGHLVELTTVTSLAFLLTQDAAAAAGRQVNYIVIGSVPFA